MLILTRKENESVIAETSDGTIEFVIVRSGETVRVGIEAPKAIAIRRGELPPKKEVA